MYTPKVSSKELYDSLPEQAKVGLGYAKQAFMNNYGMTSEEFDKFISIPSNLKMMLAFDTMNKYRIVAECIESRCCGAGIQVGQKFYFQTIPNMFLPEESDAPPCIKALGPLANHMHGIWERMFEGLDPSAGMSQCVSCLDMGLEYGGIGHVVFHLYCEEIEPAEK